MANELATDKKTIAETFGASAGNDNSFNKDIVNYRDSTLTTDKKEFMDKLIASIDPKDLNSITTFGKEPTQVMGDSSEAILRRLQNTTGFLGGFASVKEKLANFDFEGVGKMAEAYAKKIARNIEMAGLTWLKNPIRKLFYTLTGASKSKIEIEDVRHQVDKSLLQLSEVVSDLEEAKAKIPQVVKDLETLEANRLTAYSDYSLYLGAGLEVYKRLKEEILPKLEAEAGNSGSPLQQVELRNLRLATTVLNTKLTDMDSFHKSSLVQLKTIDDMQEALVMSQLKIDSHLSTSQGQWKAILAEAAVTAQIADIAGAVKAADDFGDKIFEQSQKLSDLTKAMAREAFGHGTLDPVKVIQHLQKRTQDIADDLVFVTEYNKKLEGQRAALDEAGRAFREAATKITAPVVVNDNAVAVPAAKKDAMKP